jgi:hypothetical protein
VSEARFRSGGANEPHEGRLKRAPREATNPTGLLAFIAVSDSCARFPSFLGPELSDAIRE